MTKLQSRGDRAYHDDNSRTICVVTGTRAEYGLLRPVMQGIQASVDLNLLVVATGAHLLPSQGLTIENLFSDGFAPDFEVDLVVGGDSRRALGKSIGLGIIGMIDAFTALKPDALLVLGDRYEVLSATTAAFALGIPIAHMEGGHLTEGAIDDCIRHCVTKMANIHFTSTDRYGARLIQLGERPEAVHVVGSTGIDNVLGMTRISRAALETQLGVALREPVFVVTHHPVTAGAGSSIGELEAIIAALRAAQPGTVVVTGANADPEGEAVNDHFRKFVAEVPERRVFVQSLGVQGYISLVSMADLVLGNSSSGVIEAPSLGVPTVNIGERQLGRLRAPSIVDCSPDKTSILTAIQSALAPEMRAVAARAINPMGDGSAAEQIVRILEGTDLGRRKQKSFYDLPVEILLPFMATR